MPGSLLPRRGLDPKSTGRARGFALVSVILILALLAAAFVVMVTAAPSPAPGARVREALGGPAPTKVVVIANPALITIGQATNLTASVTGGTGWINYTWVLPIGCSTQNVSVLTCKPSETGNFTVGVRASDEFARSVSNSTYLLVSPAASGSTPLSASTVFLFAGLLGTAAAVVAALVMVLVLRRRRRRRPVTDMPGNPYVPPPGSEPP